MTDIQTKGEFCGNILQLGEGVLSIVISGRDLPTFLTTSGAEGWGMGADGWTTVWSPTMRGHLGVPPQGPKEQHLLQRVGEAPELLGSGWVRSACPQEALLPSLFSWLRTW